MIKNSTMMLVVVGALGSALANADCTPPAANVTIPDGNTATLDQMKAATKSFHEYDAAVKAFAECLQQEYEAKVAAGAESKKIKPDYDKRNNAEIDKETALRDKLNTEIQAYKAKNPS